MGTKQPRARAGRAHSEDAKAVEQVGVQLDVSAAPSASEAETQLDDAVFREFTVAGTQVSGDFRCPDCGYGAVVYRRLPPCPMCGGTVWESLGPLRPRRAG